MKKLIQMIVLTGGLMWLGGCSQTEKTFSVGGVAEGTVKGVVLQNKTLAKEAIEDVQKKDHSDYVVCEPTTNSDKNLLAASLGRTWTEDGIKYTDATEKLTIEDEGKFLFASHHKSKTDYNVTVFSTPKGVECTLKNGIGTIAEKNIVAIELTCTSPAKTDPEDEQPAPNKPPVANAGEDKTIAVEENVTIVGTGTDEDGEVIAYKWEEGDTVLAETASFVYPLIEEGSEGGEHNLTLTVTDDDGATDTDTMTVYIAERPIAEDGIRYIYGETKQCAEGGQADFQLSGYDPMGGDLTFEKMTGPDYGVVTVNPDGSGKIVLETNSDSGKCQKHVPNSITFKVNNGYLDSAEPYAVFTFETHDEK